MILAADSRGKRTVMGGEFRRHHLAHTHNQLTTGHLGAGFDGKSMAAANRKQAGDG